MWEMLVHEGVGHGGQSFPCQRWHLAVQSPTREDGGGCHGAALLPMERAWVDAAWVPPLLTPPTVFVWKSFMFPAVK